MIDIILSSIVYALFFGLTAYLAFKNMVLRRNIQNEIDARIQTSIDNGIILSEYQEVLQALENIKLEKSDDFVKFLSDSRDWAFDYIEDVQERIQEFDSLLSDISKWNETYGSVAGNGPHSEKITQLYLAYDKLRNLLPDSPTPNN